MVKDGQLITGQNPNSSEKLAACVLETIKPSAASACALRIGTISSGAKAGWLAAPGQEKCLLCSS